MTRRFITLLAAAVALVVAVVPAPDARAQGAPGALHLLGERFLEGWERAGRPRTGGWGLETLMLEMNGRAMITEATVFATNPID